MGVSDDSLQTERLSGYSGSHTRVMGHMGQETQVQDTACGNKNTKLSLSLKASADPDLHQHVPKRPLYGQTPQRRG